MTLNTSLHSVSPLPVAVTSVIRTSSARTGTPGARPGHAHELWVQVGVDRTANEIKRQRQGQRLPAKEIGHLIAITPSPPRGIQRSRTLALIALQDGALRS